TRPLLPRVRLVLVRGTRPRTGGAGAAMTPVIDDTHDPARRSWVESANRPGCDFPIQNLPVCVFIPPGEEAPQLGVGIGDAVMGVSGPLESDDSNAFFGLEPQHRAEFRRQWVTLLEAGSRHSTLYAQSECTFLLPATVGDYTDFYASI